jgi:hypothetical protein
MVGVEIDQESNVQVQGAHVGQQLTSVNQVETVD